MDSASLSHPAPSIRRILDRGSLTPDHALIWVLVIAVAVYLVARSVYRVYLHPLSNIPGPVGAKLTGLWQSYHNVRLVKAIKVQDAHLRYGDVVRIGPNEVSFSNPGHLKAIYGHGVGVVKTDFYLGGSFTGEDNVFSIRVREHHAARRKMMSRNFAQAPLMELVPGFLKKAENLCKQLDRPGTINVYPWIHRLGMEFIIMQILGYDPKMTETDSHHPVLRDLEVFPPTVPLTTVFPFLRRHGVHVPISSVNKPFRKCRGWNQYCMKVVREERVKEAKDKSPWIKRMTEGRDEYFGRPLTDLEVSEEIIGNLFAGSGTTSATINFLIYAVTADRKIYSKLKAELREAFPDWPARGGDLPEIHVIQKLPYTNAVISETLRRYPTIPGAMPRRVIADGGLKVGDVLIPKGTVVSAQNYSVHMHEEYFPAAQVFDPERFLDQNSKARQGLSPFSEGPRGCIGRNLAQLELQIVTSLFFRYFEVELDPSMKPEWMEMLPLFTGSPRGEKVLVNLRMDVA